MDYQHNRLEQLIRKGWNQFPYYTWLVILGILFSFSLIAYRIEINEQSTEAIYRRIEQDVQARFEQIQADRKSGKFEQFHRQELPASYFSRYNLYLIVSGELEAWSSNEIELPDSLIQAPYLVGKGKVMDIGYGSYYVQYWHLLVFDKSKQSTTIALTLIPIAQNYPLENKFFQNDFAADQRIKSADVDVIPLGAAQPVVRSEDGTSLFSLSFIHDPVRNFKSGWLSWIGFIVTSLWLFAWVHHTCKAIGRRYRPLYGWFSLIVFCTVYTLTIQYILPDGFTNSKAFSPEIFASTYLQSIGKLYLFVVFITWILIYFIVLVPFKKYRMTKNKQLDIGLKLIAASFLTILIYSVLGAVTSQIVMDSKISFEVGNFQQLNGLTFLGLYLVTLSTINIIIVLVFVDRILQTIRSAYWFRYGIFLAVSLVYILVFAQLGNKGYFLIMMCACMLSLLLVNRIGKPIYLNSVSGYFSNSARNYIWFAWLCTLVALEVFYFNYTKEKQLRIVFAEKQIQKDDAQLELSFFQLQYSFPQDTVARTYWNMAEKDGGELLHFYILQNYFKDQQIKYQINTYLYNPQWKPLNEEKVQGTELVNYAKRSNLDLLSGFVALPPNSQYNALYFGALSVQQEDSLLGYIGIELAVAPTKQEYRQTNFWEKDYNATDQQYFDQYSYGVYSNNDLVSWGGFRVLPYWMNKPEETKGTYSFKESLQNSLLTYHFSEDEWVLVNYKRNIATNILSLFSYVLAIVFLIYLGIQFFNLTQKGSRGLRLDRKLLNLTIRTKVNIAILSVIVVALFIVGIVTISIISRTYREDEMRRMRSLQNTYEQNILYYIERNPQFLNSEHFQQTDNGLTKLMQSMAVENGVDLQLFNLKGNLIASSRPELVKNNFLSSLMSPEALENFKPTVKPEIYLWEQVGDQKYRSIYTPIRNTDEKIVGYMNMPYFDTDTNLATGLSNILVTLINMYTLVFFLSGLASIFISNSVIRSFRLLINQFRAIRLKHNELVYWPYRDEIGLLVKEYNIMIKKVEDMAFRLARTEREDAWRDIARQVAHEIKNPLTPMKLQIQFLQQAIRNKHPHVDTLTQNTTKSLIEQIENLDVIATEFSNFARMPDPKPEFITLNETLAYIIDIFRKTETTRIFMVNVDSELKVYADKNFFIRVFNNLIKNALQAIPDHREGLIEINCQALSEESVCISVKDNGSGIAEELIEKIFVPYFTSKSSGTGIGLPMTKHMVELSGGKISFTTQPGVGTVFTVILPRNNDDSQDKA